MSASVPAIGIRLAFAMPRSLKWPQNALRTVIYVAARGAVGRSELGEFQLSLPQGAWGPFPLEKGWQPLKPVLSWCNTPQAGTRTMRIGELLQRLVGLSDGRARGEDRRLLDDVSYLVEQEKRAAALDADLEIPKTELGVKLGHRHSYATRTAYEEALWLSGDASEQNELGNTIDFEAAAAALRHVSDIVRPAILYEAAGDPRAVARALLRKRSSVRLRQERCAVVFSPFESSKVHRLFILSRLTQKRLTDELGIRASLVVRSTHPTEAVEALPFPDIEPELQRASLSPRI